MRRFFLVIAVGTGMSAFIGVALQVPSAGPYKVLKTAKVGGVGGFDYVYADDAGSAMLLSEVSRRFVGATIQTAT
jgi:hypothetical protein